MGLDSAAATGDGTRSPGQGQKLQLELAGSGMPTERPFHCLP